MLSINQISKSHGARTLFRDVTIQFDRGSRYGIVGANGSGKSTILRILSGEEDVTSGTVSVAKKLRLGVLGQDHFSLNDIRILDVVLMGHEQLWEAMVEKQEILDRAHEYFDADRFSVLEDIIERHDGYGMEARAAEVLAGLNIPTERHDQPLSVLSGGYKLRVLLAQVLASKPDALLLDEPTNHLDILSIRWLENFLRGFPGTVLVVSHDRRFLNRISTHIIDVDYEAVTVYKGNYDQFELRKAGDRERKEGEIGKREKQIADHKAFVERFRAKATKARQAQSKMKQMEKIVIEKLPESSRRFPKFRVAACRPSGKVVLTMEDIWKEYDERVVLSDVGLTVERGDRLAIIGPNGIGKSTLLKIAMGKVEADMGTSEWGYETHVGYFSQDHEEVVGNERLTVQDWLWAECPDKPIGFVRGKLAEVLFSGDEVEKRLSALSGGECARMIFAGIAVHQPNVLVLDEPTNHLDMEGIQALAEGLSTFEGTIIFVSHDRWFVSRLATRILEITPEGVDLFPGTYDEYLASSAADHLDADSVVKREKAKKKKKKR